ncbi:D-alanine--D-alanine ligase A [Campylobacter pinnipediorum subsp. caledonicus]|uniref:D-alanine--D-alanine ligase n=1 Tax=Campylobacter pinnipediorum TaxID=1965231 RepID=UPI0009953019|nr:D-alanine--D-alanine ligase [Campylobacter pinnipediorum]OPA72401.1 D-alanine--D-alanine ligase A [Campylobacter pinnipediorum subsp. caledonicus]
MKLGIVFGAKSFEHEISVVSAIVLKNVLNEECVFVFCDSLREFYLIESKNMKANFFSKGLYKKSKKLTLKQGGFYTTSIFGESKINTDVFINLIHGMDGEDGKIASLFDFFGVDYIGPRLEASVLSFNKELTKLFAKKVGVKTLDYEVIRREDNPKTSYPFILKPLRLGSSIGVSVVKTQDEFDYAKDIAFEFDNDVLVEPFVENVKEYNLAGCIIDDEFKFSIIEEPKKSDFLDFEQKYLSFSNEQKVKSADISKELEDGLKNAFMKIYKNTFEGALIRCDFFVIDNEIYLNEINPNPGSLAHYLFDDFKNIIISLSNSLPDKQNINIDYKFLSSIISSKGNKI